MIVSGKQKKELSWVSIQSSLGFLLLEFPDILTIE